MQVLELPLRGPWETEDAKLTCYLKDNTEGKPKARRRAVVICPGGGYAFCSTREAEPVAFQFLAMDCQAFVLHYTTKQGSFPRALQELAAAVALIRERAKEWHIRENGIMVCGFSAGGHLAASLGVFWDRDMVWKALGLSKEAARPDGLILCYPVITSGTYAHIGSFRQLLGEDAPTGRETGGAAGGQGEDAPTGRETGGAAGEQAGEGSSLWELVSLEKQAGPQVPPVFLWHTDTDATVPTENSLLFAWALRRAGVSLELHIFPEGRHGLALANEETAKDADDGRGTYVVPSCQAWISLVREWMKRI